MKENLLAGLFGQICFLELPKDQGLGGFWLLFQELEVSLEAKATSDVRKSSYPNGVWRVSISYIRWRQGRPLCFRKAPVQAGRRVSLRYASSAASSCGHIVSNALEVTWICIVVVRTWLRYRAFVVDVSLWSLS